MCYPEVEAIADYLNDPSTRALLGIRSPRNFSSCSPEVAKRFHAHMDREFLPVSAYVAALLERGVRVLVYVGENDWICNWIGNERWTLDLDWSGREEFKKLELR